MSESKIFNPKWPDSIKSQTEYKVLCDDKGRDGGCWLKVFVAVDGDVHVSMMDWEDIKSDENSHPDPFPSIRIRTFAGGGRNHRTHQALLLLADAIRRDNEENGRQ